MKLAGRSAARESPRAIGCAIGRRIGCAIGRRIGRTVGRRIGCAALVAMCAALASACGSPARRPAWETERERPNGSHPITSTVAVASLATRAEEAWAQRDSESELDKAIGAWEELLESDAGNAAVLLSLSRAHYFRADAHLALDEVDRDEAETAAYQSALDYAERALMVLDPQFEKTMREDGNFEEAIAKLDERAVPAAYWYCLALARYSAKKGLSMRMANAERLQTTMERVRQLSPDYAYAGPDRFLGAHYAALPSVIGKNLQKSEEYFRAAREKFPEYLGTRVMEAQFLAIEKEDRDAYAALLSQVLAAPDSENPDFAPENRAAKRTAKKLLATIDERF